MHSVSFLPYNGAGKIIFGLSRDEARKSLGDYKEFRKTKFSKNTSDDFSFCHVFYDEQNNVEAVEYFDSAELIFKGKNLLSLRFEELKSFLKQNAIDFQEDESGIISDSIGLSAYSPGKGKIETILICRRGYYD